MGDEEPRRCCIGDGGRHPDRSPEAGFDWTKKSAEAGLTEGKTRLGYLYLEGIGTARDEAAALRLFNEAALEGNPTAMNNYGMMLQQGPAACRWTWPRHFAG